MLTLPPRQYHVSLYYIPPPLSFVFFFIFFTSFLLSHSQVPTHFNVKGMISPNSSDLTFSPLVTTCHLNRLIITLLLPYITTPSPGQKKNYHENGCHILNNKITRNESIDDSVAPPQVLVYEGITCTLHFSRLYDFFGNYVPCFIISHFTLPISCFSLKFCYYPILILGSR